VKAPKTFPRLSESHHDFPAIKAESVSLKNLRRSPEKIEKIDEFNGVDQNFNFIQTDSFGWPKCQTNAESSSELKHKLSNA
jgi:hypothetical protein